jgi:hypothetical protein
MASYNTPTKTNVILNNPGNIEVKLKYVIFALNHEFYSLKKIK